jgi:hypothetical protein
MSNAEFVAIAALAPFVAATVLVSQEAQAAPTAAAAEATFISAEGCIVTDIELTASEPTSYGPSNAGVDILRYDKCTSRDPVAFIVGTLSLPEQAFQVQSQGETAVLRAVIPGYDYVTKAPVALDVAVTWTARGPGIEHRPAVAAGHIISKGRNFAPNPTRLAEIELPRS